MTPELAYFMKVNVAFVLLYAFYRLFFYKDTFFKLRRTILLVFFGLSLLYPLMNIQDWVKEQEPMVGVIQVYSAILPEVSVAPEAAVETDWQSTVLSGLFWLYCSGVVLLLIRFLTQLGSILLLARNTHLIHIHGVPVHILNRPTGPFSFFKLIFLHPEGHSEKEIDEILTHERTHALQWHSIDVVICELICIVCWVNPFVWLLKREVRHNLEYLADDTVLESGYDSRSYQYHLLGLAHTDRSDAVLYNSFNVLHIKNRISMMNKKRSRGIGRAKYLAVVPFFAFLMLLSNIDAVARITENILPQQKDNLKVSALVIDYMGHPVAGANVIIKGTTTGTITDNDGIFMLTAPVDATLEISEMSLQKREIAVKDVKENMKIQLVQLPVEERVFGVVEVMPQFPGGQDALINFLQDNVKYPEAAKAKGIKGRVICSFVVGKDGSIGNIEIMRGIDPELDTEAVRVLGLMPKWTPGKQSGHDVAVKYTVPITFGGDKKTAARSNDSKSEPANYDRTFTVVEKMPEFPGGQEALLQYLAKSMKYPVIAQENGIQGRVTCSFVIKKDGSIADIEVIRGIDPSLDREAIRILNAMPNWKPGQQRGHDVAVKYTVPITFDLKKYKAAEKKAGQ